MKNPKNYSDAFIDYISQVTRVPRADVIRVLDAEESLLSRVSHALAYKPPLPPAPAPSEKRSALERCECYGCWNGGGCWGSR